jgi:anti-sigma factor RsiW
MESERLVAGMRCSEVLADLSDYLDGAVDAARRGQIEAHLHGCDYCERFGREFSTTIATLRHHLAEPEPLAPDVRARLRKRVNAD